jgi:hypothetical protein
MKHAETGKYVYQTGALFNDVTPPEILSNKL